MRTNRRILAALVVAVLAAACGSDDGTSPDGTDAPGPYDPAAELQADLIVLDPAVARPGARISITFPDERVRGVHFVLESRQGDAWSLEYHLISDWGDGRETRFYPADTPDLAVEDIGIGGVGPDAVDLPDGVAPGGYRICTGNSRPNICALLTIADG